MELLRILSQVEEKNINKVDFLDHLQRSNLVSLYQESDLVVFPSLRESFGYICVEAMACGKAVIATYCGGPEEIIDDGKTGFLVSPGNTMELAEKICLVLRDSFVRQTVGAAAREKILNRYESSVVAKQIETLYLSVIKSHQVQDD